MENKRNGGCVNTAMILLVDLISHSLSLYCISSAKLKTMDSSQKEKNHIQKDSV
jgi:hypothetical protein